MRVICVCLNPSIDISSEAETVYPVSKVRTHSERISPGGGGVNVARVLSAFGLSCELVYIAGGITGDLLAAELEKLQIDAHRLAIPASTRLAYTVLQTSTQQEYRFVPDGPEIQPQVFKECLTYLSGLQLNSRDLVVISGSLPIGIPDDGYGQIAEIINKQNAQVILDSSGRGLEAALSCDHKFFLVKPSLNELERLAGRKLDEQGALDYAHTLIHHGVSEHIAVSMGSHGASLINENSTLRLPAQVVKLQSAVGAGDSFVGGMVYYLALGHDLETAFRYGLAAGSAAVMTSADKLCVPTDVEALYQSIKSVAAI